MSSTSSAPSPTESAGAPVTSAASGSPPANPPPNPGPPYPPTTAQLGLTPSPLPDTPIALVLAVLFLAAAAGHLAVFARNRRQRQRRRRKFVFSALLALFCLARVAALALRCAWAAHPRSARLGVAGGVLTAAGVVVLFVVNLAFALRVVRAWHPFFGWGRGVGWVVKGLGGGAVLVVVAVVTVTVQGAFVADAGARARAVDRGVQLGCVTFLAVCALLPMVVVALAAVVPRRTRVDGFGEGRFGTKVALLTVTASLLAAGAIFRAVVAYQTRPVDRPAWFHGKACYYCFNYVVELLVVYIYGLSRFDKRFHIPDGSSAPGHYSCAAEYGLAGRASAESNGDFEKSRRKKKRGGGGDDGRLGGELETKLWPPPAARAPSKGSSHKSMHSVVRAASSSYGAGSSQSSLVRLEDMEWMTRAMRELYGDEEAQRQHQEPGGWLSCVKLGGLSDFGNDYETGVWANGSGNDGREQVKSPAFTEWSF